ncbi:MAG: fibronectin type III domain-containing protein [Isosphaeraceae bacterium]
MAWTDNSDDETGFTIERSPNGSSGWTQIASPIANATSYNDTGLTAGTAYFYRIKATNGVGSSTPTATATATTYAAPTVPAAPSDLGATVVSSSQVNLTWTDNSDNETGFILEQSPNGSSGWTQIASPAANANSYNATGLIAETLYFYRIKAVNDTGSSAYSTTATATTTKAPDANSPTNLQGVAPSDFDVFLTWDRANDNETSVLVDRSGDGGSTWNNVATLPAGENLWFDRSLWPGTTYKWRVRVEIDGQVSSPSETVAVTTMTSDAFRISFGTSTGIFTLPSDAAVANLDRWTNQLSFTDPNTGYKGQWNIDRSSDGGVTYQNLWMIPNTGTATTWTDRYLTPGQSYLYRMRLESPDYGLTDFMGPFSATTPSLGDLPAAATALCVNTYQLDLGGATTGAFALTIRDGMHGSFSATTPSLPFNSAASAVRDALRALCAAWTNDRNLPCDVVVAQTGAGVFLIGLTDGALLVQGVITSGDGVLTITERQTATNMTLLWEDHTGGAAAYKVETGQQIWPPTPIMTVSGRKSVQPQQGSHIST